MSDARKKVAAPDHLFSLLLSSTWPALSIRSRSTGRHGAILRAAFSLTELVVSAGLWGVIAAAIAAAAATGARGLTESQRAGQLCRAAAALDAAVAGSARIRAPGTGWTARELLLVRQDGTRLRYLVERGRLVERDEHMAGQRTLAAGIDHVLFFTRGTRPPIVRYFVSSREQCLISSTESGGRK